LSIHPSIHSSPYQLHPHPTFSSKGDALHIRRVALRQGRRCAVQIVADAAALVRRGRRTPARHGGEGGIEGGGARLADLGGLSQEKPAESC